MAIDSIKASSVSAVSSTSDKKEVEEKKEELKSIEKTKESASIKTTGSTSAEISAEIKKLESQKELNYRKMAKLEEEIDNLKESAKAHIMEAAGLQEKETKKMEEKSKVAVNKCLEEYIKANKEGGSGMTRDDLALNIANALPKTSLSEAVTRYVLASKELGEMDFLLGDLNSIILDTDGIEIDLKSQQDALEKAIKEETTPKKSCDPIGFTTNDNKIKYDFIVDDGAFDSTSDFLGADNQWASMQALDTDKDGTVTSDELQKGNIKMVKTENGKQSVVDIKKEFGSDFSINLNSYKEGGSHSAIDTLSDFDKDGLQDQQLLGTFDLNINGESIKGYNTLDDIDFLNKEYGVEISEQSKFSSELSTHFNFFTTRQAEMNELDNELNDGLTQLGVTEANIKEIKEISKKEGDKEAKEISEKIDKEEKEEQERLDAIKAEEEAKAKAEEEAKAKAEEEAKAKEEAEAEEEAKKEKDDDDKEEE